MTEKKVWFITGAGRGLGVDIATTIVNPGFIRTDLLTKESTSYAAPSIADYAGRHAERVQWYEAQSGNQSGDPAKLARALVTIASLDQPPRRFIAGADAIALAERKAADLLAQVNTYRDLSTSLAVDATDTEGVPHAA